MEFLLNQFILSFVHITAPSPSNVEQVLGTKCLVKDNFQLAIPRDRQDELGNFLPKNCQRFFDQIDR